MSDLIRSTATSTAAVGGGQGKTSEQILRSAAESVRTGDLEAARRLLSTMPQNESAHPDIQLAGLLFEQGRVNEARARLEQFSAVPANAFEAHLLHAELAVNEGRWFDALTHVHAARAAPVPSRWNDLRKKTVRATLLVMEGVSLEGLRQWQTARQVYEKAAPADSELPGILSGRARTAFYLGDPEQAAGYFRELRVTQPQLPLAELLLARLFSEAEKPEEAERWFARGLKSENPLDRSSVRLAYADWLLYRNQPDQALATLSDEQFDAARQTERQYLMALALRMQQRFDEAQNLLKTLHHQDAASFPVSNQLALVMIESDDDTYRSRALQIAESNVRNNSNLAEAWSTLGWIQFRLGDVASAEKNLATAIQSGTTSRDTVLYMARVKQRLGAADVANELLAATKNSTGPVYAPLSDATSLGASSNE
ncbi:MAG: tetratricopeptide repeat protein [Fuerstiella sp.]